MSCVGLLKPKRGGVPPPAAESPELPNLRPVGALPNIGCGDGCPKPEKEPKADLGALACVPLSFGLSDFSSVVNGTIEEEPNKPEGEVVSAKANGREGVGPVELAGGLANEKPLEAGGVNAPLIFVEVGNAKGSFGMGKSSLLTSSDFGIIDKGLDVVDGGGPNENPLERAGKMGRGFVTDVKLSEFPFVSFGVEVLGVANGELAGLIELSCPFCISPLSFW